MAFRTKRHGQTAPEYKESTHTKTRPKRNQLITTWPAGTKTSLQYNQCADPPSTKQKHQLQHTSAQ